MFGIMGTERNSCGEAVFMDQTEFQTFCLVSSNEQACIQKFLQVRWPKGFRCPQCGGTDAYAIRTRRLLFMNADLAESKPRSQLGRYWKAAALRLDCGYLPYISTPPLTELARFVSLLL